MSTDSPQGMQCQGVSQLTGRRPILRKADVSSDVADARRLRLLNHQLTLATAFSLLAPWRYKAIIASRQRGVHLDGPCRGFNRVRIQQLR